MVKPASGATSSAAPPSAQGAAAPGAQRANSAVIPAGAQPAAGSGGPTAQLATPSPIGAQPNLPKGAAVTKTTCKTVKKKRVCTAVAIEAPVLKSAARTPIAAAPAATTMDGDWAVGNRRGKLHFDLDTTGRLTGSYTQDGFPDFHGVWNGGCVPA